MLGLPRMEGLTVFLHLHVNFYLRIVMISVRKNYICHVVEDFQTSTFLFWIIFKQAPFFPIYFLRVSLGKLNFFINYTNSFLFLNK